MSGRNTELSFSNELMGDSKFTRLRRKFKNELYVATIGWDFCAYRNKDTYNEEGVQSLSDFCNSLELVEKYLRASKLRVELLLCAGLAVNNVTKFRLLNFLQRLCLSNIANILFEIREKPQNTWLRHYVFFDTKRIRNFPTQIFSKSYEKNDLKNSITRNNSVKLQRQLLTGSRSFYIGNKKFSLIICGENNMIKNNKIGTIKPLIIEFSRSDQDAGHTCDLLSSSIILNPSHTPYRINGRKRLEMMKNSTGSFMKVQYNNSEYSLKFPLYIHANNYFSGAMADKSLNKKIGSAIPNGSFLFKFGKQEKVLASWQNVSGQKFILNIWSVA